MVLLLDGGTGLELKIRPNAAYDLNLFSAKALIHTPDEVRKVHEDYISAGVDILTTNTFACVDFYLKHSEVKCNQEGLIQLAVDLAKEARSNSGKSHVKIAGGVPPLTECYRPDLVKSRELMEIEYRPFISSLANGIDLWLLETLTTLDEFEVIASLIREYSSLPIIVSFVPNPDGTGLRDSTPWKKVITSLSQFSGISHICVNCQPPEVLTKALYHLQKCPFKTGAYANGWTNTPPANWSIHHQVHDCNNNVSSGMKVRTDLGPENYLRFVTQWISLGANLIGGCCRIGVDHIERIHRHLQSRAKL